MNTAFVIEHERAVVNHLAPVGRDRYHLPRHARIVVFDGGERELLTVYDCGYAQKPPSAQVLGSLGRVGVDHDIEHTPTGYAVTIAERAVFAVDASDHYRIVPADG